MKILERTDNSFRLLDYTYCELQIYEDGYYRFKHYYANGGTEFVDSCNWDEFKSKVRFLLGGENNEVTNIH